MTLEEFLTARLNELREALFLLNMAQDPWLTLIDSQLEIVQMHAKWPVFIDEEPTLSVFDDYDIDRNRLSVQVSKKIIWMEQQEYVKKFGTQPATAPFIRKLVERFSHHEDFQEEWL